MTMMPYHPTPANDRRIRSAALMDTDSGIRSKSPLAAELWEPCHMPVERQLQPKV
ncbi:hypothetical protein BofuT4_P051930.1 [Botrytis cinerea T4]|uniref:Uncharacterized protein n=1 Tax=Botryotinia fuckeliana (strain T4) TaxID=999810 RepID=G2XWH4_BOTF4|nr:hypothetical protein BofuT4_P051930.1 [Botrytis cinerea T4]